ncbi:cobalt-zinc-cadmium efflux system protein [Dysgonomonas sp. PH5-45]|uniref:cation diffusion facilitator family transporter n=1 Tax=unclassified Dysgonomonas TaxID=2630389 RepID=UPI0024759C9E|nr:MULTISPECIES: cation diffusion facilitator family transporter [unclassified Dysgonomonas]MDH6354198.1 cobalt-zinc-cadmium efflux system protein [Dysgonomonas sp. PH5-45]MDH6387099.1 cobalt-zinc-cadmium efflux system protein [Dysgonomonas sp. PH5-37]
MSDHHNHHNKKHDHEHGHSHSHTHNANKTALSWSFVLIAGFMFVEFVGGFLTNSLALLSDAGHMLSDAVALGLSLSAAIFGARAATQDKTYGYKRFEILAALLNGLVLVVISVFICKEAIERISSPTPVVGKGMIIISTIGLIINIIVAYILSRGETKDNLNVKSAFMHVLGDLLGSVGAIVAAILIIAFGWNIADPIASIIVSILVLFSGWRILRESLNVLMEAKPANIDSRKIIQALKEIPEVKDIHDMHIWTITSDFPAFTAHLKVDINSDRDQVLQKAITAIEQISGIKHITLQIEGAEMEGHQENCCDGPVA